MIKKLLTTSIAFLFVSLLFQLSPLQLAGQPISSAQAANPVDATIGSIDTPPGVTEQIAKSGLGPNDVAIFFLLSSLIKVANVVAGIWVAFNIVFAAFNYLGGQGSADSHKKVRDKLTMSVLGLFLLAVSYAVVAVISKLLFGDAGYILNPTL